MFSEWLIYTVIISTVIYIYVKLNYNKALLIKEKRSNLAIKENLEDAELLIRKYQTQLQRSIGNIDLLTKELNKIKTDIKSLRTRNSQYRLENDQLNKKIKELEDKIEALL